MEHKIISYGTLKPSIYAVLSTIVPYVPYVP
nr:MAG TPA: hypothetical protein [Caudoviricetes sp.]DAO85905.1 MAG TPA: hypothetical protein [Caudoviricetes sp.]